MLRMLFDYPILDFMRSQNNPKHPSKAKFLCARIRAKMSAKMRARLGAKSIETSARMGAKMRASMGANMGARMHARMGAKKMRTRHYKRMDGRDGRTHR